MEFVGRGRELGLLRDELGRIGSDTQRPGRCLLIRGRRRVGKSRLVEAFVDRAEVPSLYFTAAGAGGSELIQFCRDAAESTLPDAELISAGRPQDWDAAFSLLAAALPTDRPSVVVIDEAPYLMDPKGSFEGVLQRVWDRRLSRRPVLLILIGSDLSMMESLNSYGRPFHQRGREMVVGPLNPAEVGSMLGLPAADAIDAALVTGGLPLICAEWGHGAAVWDFLGRVVEDPTSALLVSGERSLAAEFPQAAQARAVLGAVGSGERTFSRIANAAGGLGATQLTRALNLLVDKGLVAGELPVSLRPSRDRRYRITDPYLRFWLEFLGPYLAEIERGSGRLTLARMRRGWSSWRGRAIEPLARDAVARLLPRDDVPSAGAVGGYWTRTNDVEIDVVGADRQPVARTLAFVGSIKWSERATCDVHDLARLHAQRARLTDDVLPTVAVTRTGRSCQGVTASFGPSDLVDAWNV